MYTGRLFFRTCMVASAVAQVASAMPQTQKPTIVHVIADDLVCRPPSLLFLPPASPYRLYSQSPPFHRVLARLVGPGRPVRGLLAPEH